MTGMPAVGTTPWAAATTHSVDRPARADVVVVGAGIVGATTALLLAEAGTDVALVDRSDAAATTTGHSTAKVTALHGTRYQTLVEEHGVEVAARYAAANCEALAWLRRRCAGAEAVRWSDRSAFTYAATPSQRPTVDAEAAAARSAGLAVTLVEEIELPGSSGAVRLDEQGQVDPVGLLEHLLGLAAAAGARLAMGTHVTGVHRRGAGVEVRYEGGAVQADHVVLATHLAFLDRTLQFARNTPSTSYALAVRHPTPPQGMYLSAGSPTRSVREAADGAGPLLLVGGAGHQTGHVDEDTAQAYAQLQRFAADLGGGEVVARWSAEDFSSHDTLPTVGAALGGRVHFATGFGKWGLTNGVAAAQVIVAALTGAEAPAHAADWAPRASGLRSDLRANADVAAHLVGGWAGALVPRAAPAEGHGVVRAALPAPVATSCVDGQVREVSAVCRHLGGIVAWNGADGCWDCPLHGSRFAADGTLLHGPSVRGLRRR